MMETPAFTVQREVTDEDIDNLGHASNIAYVRWIQDIAVAHSVAVGLDYEAYVRLGAVFVIRRHEIDYLRPLLRGETIELRTWISTVMAAKCQRATEITKGGVAVGQALTTWGFIDVATGRPTRIPDAVRIAFGVAPRERGNARTSA
jgi:acyl-CoA thioester hydrolase